ncbi:maleylpyruvate isomerase N-terminal domain-containing protein, partial [Nonomuraea sp. NPDC050451]|uniref:maleylpyruvate isomerase N-terminal domain-containing protein n=1 Tax=Nonomuraea sp. NPDC050451 TaxID=3364364 RepID=UPI0037B09E55
MPGWTRGHVLAHVAQNADSHVNLLTWAKTDVKVSQYASYEARSAAIEAVPMVALARGSAGRASCRSPPQAHRSGATRPATRHLADPENSATRHLADPENSATRHLADPENSATRHLADPET